ncbi:MAG TPA: hypothetical protein VMY37_33980 [Thermoguttaceae bacterium]|nr:hypothetical protein [Thermoguttaceae bacterium]
MNLFDQLSKKGLMTSELWLIVFIAFAIYERLSAGALTVGDGLACIGMGAVAVGYAMSRGNAKLAAADMVDTQAFQARSAAEAAKPTEPTT